MQENQRLSTDFAARIAQWLDICIDTDSATVAAVRIECEVAARLRGTAPEGATPRQIAFGRVLGIDLSRESKCVASAMIQERVQAREREALARLALRPGMRVVKSSTVDISGTQRVFEKEFVVSSIGADCRVFFKGGNGQGGWPTQLRLAVDKSSAANAGS